MKSFADVFLENYISWNVNCTLSLNNSVEISLQKFNFTMNQAYSEEIQIYFVKNTH